MALITCPECGKEVSDQAGKCPNCGHPVGATPPKKGEEKTTGERRVFRMTLGIIMLVLSVLTLFQSCAVGVVNAGTNTDGMDGTLGILFTMALIVFGILGIVTSKTKSYKTIIIIGVIMTVIGISVALGYNGIYEDLKVWSWLLTIFGMVFIISGARMRGKEKGTA